MEEVHALSFELNFPFCLPNFCDPTFPIRFTEAVSTIHFIILKRYFQKPLTSISDITHCPRRRLDIGEFSVEIYTYVYVCVHVFRVSPLSHGIGIPPRPSTQLARIVNRQSRCIL